MIQPEVDIVVVDDHGPSINPGMKSHFCRATLPREVHKSKIRYFALHLRWFAELQGRGFLENIFGSNDAGTQDLWPDLEELFLLRKHAYDELDWCCRGYIT